MKTWSPGSLLGLTALPPTYWIALAGILLAYMILTQIVKSWLIKRFGLS